MRRIPIACNVQSIGSIALAAALVACGGEVGGEDGDAQSQGRLSPSSSYSVVIIDAANFTHEPTAINNRGQITGSARNDEDVRAAWHWDGEEGHFILGDRPDGSGIATDINQAGQVVGSTLFLRNYSEMPESFQFRSRAFLYDGTTVRDFGVLDGNSQSRAEGINARGDMVGSSFGGTGEEHAVVYVDGQIIDLGRDTRSRSTSIVKSSARWPWLTPGMRFSTRLGSSWISGPWRGNERSGRYQRCGRDRRLFADFSGLHACVFVS